VKAPYWIATGLLAAFMLLGSIPDLLRVPQAVAFFMHLGYPAYLLPFLGVAKTLGVLAVVVPGFPRLREWAYAGLTFDLSGALYSHLSVGDPAGTWSFPVIGLFLVTASYLLHRQVSPLEAAWEEQGGI
jgi:uncharacterized membrane protein YphA (DoxX/SURF4 family)